MGYQREENCIFCKILDGEIPSRKVYEDDSFLAILDVNPATKGHVIIISKNHAANIFELSEKDAKEVYLVAKKIATALKTAYNPEGVNILQNNGEVAGQTVFHLHMHVIPRYKDDTVTIDFGDHEPDDLDQVLEDIKKVM